MSTDKFKTIQEPALGVVKDKGSKFNAYLLPVKSEESFRAQLDLLKSQEPNARHYCWAYRLDPENLTEKSNDDGEPSNTAGAPILRALTSAGLINVACVVVRYFGGTKLGVPGLINAYGGGAKQAIENAQIREETITRQFEVIFSYSELSYVERTARETGAEILQRIQEQDLLYVLSVEKSKLLETREYFEKNHRLRTRAI